MNIVLLSGGSGARLWPLSNGIRSKQFLKLLKDENGKSCSMIQRTYSRITASGISEGITVTTSELQADVVRSQLGLDVDIVTESERRNTFPAILLSCAHLYYRKNVSPDEIVGVVPVDAFVELEYFNTISKMRDIIDRGSAKLALMGIAPTYPSEKYGYIIPKHYDEKQRLTPVEEFREKPLLHEAESLLKEGALWNGGVFVFKLKYVLDIINNYIEAKSYSDVANNYNFLPKNSFDYEVVEREKSLAVVCYNGPWKDLGTWNTLTEEISENKTGRVEVDETTTNTHVINELNLPMIVIGAKNMIIAASYDGILISDKYQSSYMKPLVEHMEQRPMYEERRWGEYKVLDFKSSVGEIKSLTKCINIETGKAISYQKHKHRQEVWVVTRGVGEFKLNGDKRLIRQGDVLTILAGDSHSVKALEALEIIEVQLGEFLDENDVERIQ